MSIITFTPNPCIDISSSVVEIVPEKKLRCSHIKKDAGGGGINVSRVITRFGGDTTALYLAGGYTGDLFTSMLHAENVKTQIVKTENETRENFIIDEESTKKQFRFGMPGPAIKRTEWENMLQLLSEINNADFIIASGSLPESLPVDFFAKAAIIAGERKTKFIVDTSGEALKQAINEGAYLIKPNLGELSFLSGVKELTTDSAIAESKKIIAAQKCEVIVVSMGKQGALLITENLTQQIIPPDAEIKSTVGAGDSMVAGITLSLTQNKSLTDAVKYGVACGTAATMNEGTSLCEKKDADEIFKNVAVKNL